MSSSPAIGSGSHRPNTVSLSHSDSEALLEAEAAKGLPPVVHPYAYHSPLEVSDHLPAGVGEQDVIGDPSETLTTPNTQKVQTTRPESAPSEHSEASVSCINVLPPPWSARVAPSEDKKLINSSDNQENREPIDSPEGTASVLSSSAGTMPRSDGGLDREDTVEMREYRRRQENGDPPDKPRYAPSWPTPEELDEAEGLGRGLKTSDSTEDLSNLISIHQAARDGATELMSRYLEQIGSNKRRRVNKLDENNLSALHYAARYNHEEIVKLLIKHHADPQCKGEDNTTPMHHAARCKRSSTKASPTGSGDDDDDDNDDMSGGVISYLEAEGADVNAQDIYGQTPLHFAAMRGNDIATKELLSSEKIKFEATDKQLMTPLHMACTHGHLVITKMLIQQGAMLRCLDEEGNTPLLKACMEGHVDIVQLLFEAGEEKNILEQMLTDADYDQNTPLHVAVESGKQQIVQMCLEKGANMNIFDKQRNTPLHIAAAAGHLDIVKMLLSKTANVDSLNADRATPLHRACAFNREEVVEYLLKSGARIERRDKDNFTPLLIAASNGHSATISVLLKYGANIRAVDKHEKSSIYWAAQENEVQALKVLLDHRKHKAKKLLMASDRYNNTPLHVAAENGFINVIKILLDHGANLEAKNEEEQTALHLAAQHGRVHTLKELVRQDLTGINDEDENSNTPLHLAASEGHAKCVLALIDAGADIEARNQSLWTPLDCSAASGWVKCATALLENDSPIDPTDKAKTTPLHLASKNGHVDMVKLLCERGADLSLKDESDYNCLDHAIDKGHEDVARAIIAHKHWQHAMYSVSRDKFTKMRSTPMRKLIKKMPDVAIAVFNRCVSENDYPPEHKRYCITFDYELLDDMFSKWDDNSPDNVSEVSGNSDDNSPFLENGNLSPTAVPYSSSSKMLRVNHPLTIMVKSKRDDLLGHPLVTSLMQHKWDSYGRFFYYSSLLFYALFLVFLTGYVVTNPPSFYYKVNSTDGTFEWMADGQQRWERDFSSATHFLFGNVGHWVIIVLSAVNILKELGQLFHQKLNYIGWVNLLEWAIYVLSILFVLPLSGVYYPYGTSTTDCSTSSDTNCIMLRLDWQWQIGAVAVFLAWINLILFLRKFPQFGIYIVMFTGKPDPRS
ncbi:transient receptor potential cation channel subfamily A member 1 homolog [Acanthaster planci]|uniref:Transient receptor potential cation channel subfamily A member 1 homolog n=1 Tax=Acanthaster planci TaxID=133434 RepID=A0A8B7Z4X5_ACAPL|nr:transient receptor potential cation channel subfamily A member 1 homolog [Acanthaster planci]